MAEHTVSDLPFGLGRRMLTLEQTCQWFAVSETTIRGMVDRRTIPFRKVGSLLRFPEAELEDWSQPKPKEKGRDVSLVRVSSPRQRRQAGDSSLAGITYEPGRAATPTADCG